nr:phosphopantetheine attachment site protein [uncultured bacterium]
MTDGEIHCRLRLRNTDLVMQNHHVHGVAVLPGVVLLEMSLRILAARGHDPLAARGHDPARFALERILFTEPMVTDDSQDREISIDLRLPDDRPGWVTAQSRPWGSDLPFAPSMQAVLVIDETPPLPDLDIAARKATARAGLDMAELYRRARIEEIKHGPKMRCVGQLWVGTGELLAELALEVPGTTGFLMHPGAMDATTIAAFGQTEQASRDPFIPVAIDRFRALRSLPERFVLHAPRTEVLAATREVISNDYDLYDTSGRHCASFRKLTCKRIRQRELITRLLERPGAAAAPVPSPASPAPQAVSVQSGASGSYADMVRTWVSEMLGVERSTIRADVGFYELGLDSRALLSLSSRLEEAIGSAIYPTLLFEHPDIASLEAHLVATHGPPRMAPAPAESRTEARTAAAEETSQPAASTALARPAWVLDKRSRSSGAGPRRVAVVGLSAREVEELREVSGPGREVAPAGQEPEALLRAGTELPDAVVLFPPGSEAGDPGSYLASVMAWTRAASRAGRGVDVVIVERGDRPSPALQGLAAFTRSVRAETPRVAARVLLAPVKRWASEVLAELERTSAGLPATAGVIAVDGAGRSLVQVLVARPPADLGAAPGLPLPRGAVCVITGGTGGIGNILADWLLSEFEARVILLSRSAPSPEAVREWGRRGPGSIEHHACDVSDLSRVNSVLAEVRRRHGGIHAVFHAAGALADGLHFNATPAQIATVLAPKLAGFQALDAATAKDELRLFVAFSSLAAWRPNPGQGVYAFANAALEGMVARRNGSHDRSGRALSIAWPLWASGGMKLSASELATAMRSTGLAPLPSDVAMGCLKAATELSRNARQEGSVAVLHGDAARFGTWISPEAEAGEDLRPTPGPMAAPLSTGARPPPRELEIAIVGLAGRYPGASDVDELWERLCAAHDAITEVPRERWDHEAIFDARKGVPGKTYGRWGGFLGDIDVFDASMFNVSRRDAERMDPQERLFLETCWTLLEEAGHPARTLKDRNVGVFTGVMWNHYQLCGGEDVAPTAMHAAVANRVSFALDLQGPSMAVDTACSSSLTALSLAIDAIRSGACTMAIAGGVNLTVHPEKYRQLSMGQFLSEDGRCRSFGEEGTGYVPGEGVGAVLLRPLADALADGDHIWGVVRGHATNHAGRTGGFTVPSPVGQAAVIERALRNGGIDPASIGYVEAHGTGTSLGDPIEIEGLARALGTKRQRPLLVGSIKSNIGHLESAAGIAALSKVLLMLRERKLVPSLHAERPNPALRLDELGIRVQKELAECARRRGARRFGPPSRLSGPEAPTRTSSWTPGSPPHRLPSRRPRPGSSWCSRRGTGRGCASTRGG